jgi:hypothetical protein
MLISSVTIILYLNYLAAANKMETNSSIILQAFKETLEDLEMETADGRVYVETC